MIEYENIMTSGQFFLQFGWLLVIPILAAAVSLFLIIRKLNSLKVETEDETTGGRTGLRLPRWLTLCLGCGCLILGVAGLWLGGVGGKIHRFCGLFQISGFPARVIGILVAVVGGGLLFLGVMLLKDFFYHGRR